MADQKSERRNLTLKVAGSEMPAVQHQVTADIQNLLAGAGDLDYSAVFEFEAKTPFEAAAFRQINNKDVACRCGKRAHLDFAISLRQKDHAVTWPNLGHVKQLSH